MTDYLNLAGLQIDKQLVDFVEHEVLKGLDQSPNDIWPALAVLLDEFFERNDALLKVRSSMQSKIDAWCDANKNDFDAQKYQQFLRSINYLVPEGAPFKIDTTGVDSEVAQLAGPQLVVPVSNARFALNALNARYGSLYDALYASDVIAPPPQANLGYCHQRGERVVAYGRLFLDEIFALQNNASHSDVVRYFADKNGLCVLFDDGKAGRLLNPDQYVGYVGEQSKPNSIVLRNHGLHIFIELDPTARIGKADKAGVNDILVESALTTIQDFEDSVAAVDADDKVSVYRNWLGLMLGNLEVSFSKGERQLTRKAVPDRLIVNRENQPQLIRARSVLLCRNVGHLMTNPMVLLANGQEAPEGIVDGFISVLIAKHDLRKEPQLANSSTRSIYLVKPKMHGPDEAAFSNDLFNRIEDLLELPRYTIKIGVMDEERRTSVNLLECIRQVKQRVAFINTGFLDRTGDEIHTNMRLGPFDRKADIKRRSWYPAYENGNVEIGLLTGFAGKAQIGKGMWPKPDDMRQMMNEKNQHLVDGATTAWVPSPLAATLHALHYHRIDVPTQHQAIQHRAKASLSDLLSAPLLVERSALTTVQIQQELDNNIQGILGYVVRWVKQGVGCSKVPDINHVSLMEDRATLRISSQHIANWLLHGLVSPAQVHASFVRMAGIVDEQNAGDRNYQNMSPDCHADLAFQAALDLVFLGQSQANGYTEPLLHCYRIKAKERHRLTFI